MSNGTRIGVKSLYSFVVMYIHITNMGLLTVRLDNDKNGYFWTTVLFWTTFSVDIQFKYFVVNVTYAPTISSEQKV